MIDQTRVNQEGKRLLPYIASPFVQNFPFQTLRKSQDYILSEIDSAFKSGYRYILLEAPTGIGKSGIAISVALTIGTSYICTSTKDLQSQYARDFPFLKVAKGKNNFACAVKDDFVRNGTYKCGLCVSNNVNECYHTTVDYGPCMSNEYFKKSGCKYRTFEEDYRVYNKGTREEKVFSDDDIVNYYQIKYSQWSHPENLKKELRVWRPCAYYDQLNIALVSSHAIFNYSIFLSLLTYKRKNPPPTRNLLILDEAHGLEEEIVKFTGLSISKKKWRKYIPNFEIIDYGYNDIEKWIDFLTDLERKMLVILTQDVSEELVVEAKTDTEKLIQAIDNIRSNPKNW